MAGTIPVLAQRAASDEKGAPTIKQWSLDARRKGQPRPLPLREVEGVGKALAWAYGTSRRASGWAGEKVARSWDHSSHPL